MSAKVLMTVEGHVRLSEELAHLKRVEIPSVIKEIAEAREHGDLTDNAEYRVARERQGVIMERVSCIEQALAQAEVIDTSKLSGNKVQFGAKLILTEVDAEEEKRVQIVGPDEADLKAGKISVISLLGRNLLGHEVGETVEVMTPAGSQVYTILEIKYV